MGRIGGIIAFKINGKPFNAKGNFTYGYGFATKETVNGVDQPHGFKTTVNAPFIEGEITDDGKVDIADLAAMDDETVTLELGNGKIFALYNAYSLNPDGMKGNTDEGNIAVRFEGKRAKDVKI